MNTKKITLDRQLSSEIDKIVAEVPESDPSKDPFNTPAMKKAKLKAEISDALEFKELATYVEKALKILIEKGPEILLPEQFDHLMDAFAHAHETLANSNGNLENYQKILHISNEEMEAIAKMALIDFKEGQFEDSMTVFILLSTLCPENSDYWHRAGITAQKSGYMDLAIKFYNAALQLDQELNSPRLLLIDTYLTQKMFREAKSECETAKQKSLNAAETALLSSLEGQVKRLGG